MKNKRTPRVYDLNRWRENGVLRPPDINKDDFYVMKFIYPILWSLSLIGISQADVKDYVSLFKEHSQKGKKAPNSNTGMIIRNQLATIFFISL